MSSKFLDKTGLDTLWAKIKSTFQTVGNLVTAWGSTPSDTKYPSEKLVKTSLDAISTNARTIPQDISKGANLVVNGSGRMASNYNFSSFSYVPTISYGGSAGSFGYNGTNAENEYISCDFNKKIVFSADVKNLVAQPSNCIHRVYVLEFDIDKNSINAIHVMYGVGTLTELTQDLNPGDTVVHLADLSNANWLSTTTYHRGFIFWNYQNSYGYLYPPETYSRNVYPSGDSNPLWDVANVNVSAGTITLNSGWTGPVIPAGTKVSRRNSGNTYPYPATVTTGDTEWHSMKGYMKGVASPGTSERSSTKFSQGTAFIRAGIYPSNLNNTDPVINKRAVVANFAIYEEQDINDGFGMLPVDRGGTGKTSVTSGYYLVGNGTGALTEKTPTAVANNVLTNLSTGSDDVLGTDYIVGSNHTSGATDTTQFVRRTADKLWNYLKRKISSVLGLTATSYSGNAATATTATTAAGYTSGGAIDTALQGKATPSDITSAIQALDVASQGGDGKYIKAISEADGKISATAETMDTVPTTSSTKAVTSGGVKTALDGKVDTVSGKGLSANDYTTAEKNKLAGIAEGAEVNVQSDWNQTDGTSDDYIKNKPQNLVQDASYVHTDNNYTTADKNKVASAVQPGALGTAASKDVPASGDASATQVVMGSDSRLTRSVWSGGGTCVCGYKICTTAQIAGRPGQTSNIYSILMGTMCLTNKYAVEPQGSDSSGKDGALAMGSFMVWCEGTPDGSITARARLFSSNAAFNNADIAICKKYVNGAVEWFVAFGPWNSSKAVTASMAFGMSVCFDYVQNARIPDTLEAVPSGYGYDNYYSLWKHPYLQSTQQGAGSTTRPVYVTANGEVKACTYAISTSTTGTDTNTIYLV